MRHENLEDLDLQLAKFTKKILDCGATGFILFDRTLVILSGIKPVMHIFACRTQRVIKQSCRKVLSLSYPPRGQDFMRRFRVGKGLNSRNISITYSRAHRKKSAILVLT